MRYATTAPRFAYSRIRVYLMEQVLFVKLCSRYGEMMRGKRENFFSREKKPNVGFVILFPLSRHSLGDGGSLPFKKSGKLFLIYIYPCWEQNI